MQLLEQLGSIEGILDHGAKGLVAIGVLLILLGWLVPKRMMTTLRADHAAQLTTIREEHTALIETIRAEHSDREADLKEFAGIWKAAYEKSEERADKAEEMARQQGHQIEELMEIGLVLKQFITGFKVAADNKEATP